MADRSQRPTIPAGFEYIKPYLNKFLKRFPHIDRNVLVMMPFSTPSANAVYEAVRAEVQDHGLIALRADSHAFSPILWWNVVTCMLGSTYGVVVYEPVNDIPFNPNVSIEAGFMRALDKSVLFLATDELGAMPVDFAGHIFKTYSANPRRLRNSIHDAVKDWIENDLSYYDYRDKRLVVFVSLGGTCRCVMGKAILADAFDKAKLSGLTVEAAAIADPHHATVSPSAVKAVREIGCDTWIEGHRPRKLCPYLQERADLIIVLTDGSLARQSQRSDKVIRDTQLFGFHVPNPYPDSDDDASLKRYRDVRDAMQRAIDNKLPQIIELAGGTPEV